MERAFSIFVVVSMTVIGVALCNRLQCKDSNGKPVDWFTAIKLPKLDSDLSDGTGYIYMDANNQEWTYFTGITTENSAIGYTVSQMYMTSNPHNKSIMWMVYNDEPTNGSVSSSKGHSKGIVIADKNSGLWLVHSVPLFPELPDQNNSYTYPHTGIKNGQSFLCISMTAEELDKVGNQLIKNEVMIYGSHFGGNLDSTYLDLYTASLPHKIPKENKDEPRLETLLSIEGEEFLSISKGRHFEKDIYEDLITQMAHSNLYTETWLNTPDALNSSCSGHYKTMNIESLTMEKIEGLNDVLFKSSLDHSKWAITEKSSVHWTCIGDTNRSEHQGERGGGTVCIKLKSVWTQYHQLVSNIEEC